MNVAIPRFVRVRQHFPDAHISPEDIPQTVAELLAGSGAADALKPGMRVCLTCGSRGIDNIVAITRAVNRRFDTIPDTGGTEP